MTIFMGETMLNLGATERKVLAASGALTNNGAGEEVLAGLTVEETVFALRVEQTGTDCLATAEREKYLKLMIRHRRARILLAAQSVTARPPSAPNN